MQTVLPMKLPLFPSPARINAAHSIFKLIATHACLFLFYSTTCTQPSLVSLLAFWRLSRENLHSSMSRQQNSVTLSSLAKPTFTSRYILSKNTWSRGVPIGYMQYTVTVFIVKRRVKQMYESLQTSNASR